MEHALLVFKGPIDAEMNDYIFSFLMYYASQTYASSLNEREKEKQDKRNYENGVQGCGQYKSTARPQT